MNNNFIFAVALLIIWFFNGKKIIQGKTEKLPGEIYHHAGMGLFFTLIAVEYFFGNSGIFFRFNILWLKIIGYVLFIPSVIFIFGSIYQLKIKGKVNSLGPGSTNQLMKEGVFSIVRHPMWTGFSLWSLALMLHYQSIFSFLIGTITFILFRIASIEEDIQGINNFGNAYGKYMEKVPALNFFKNLFL